MDQRAAFARARDFLNFNPAAPWLALIAGAGAAVVGVTLLLVFGLFADLVVHRGKPPTLGELSAADRERFEQDWKQHTSEERQQLLQDLGVDDKSAREMALRVGDPMSSEQLQQPWQANVNQHLAERVSPEAARLYREHLAGGRPSLGVLALAVRIESHPLAGRLSTALASANPWTWEAADAHTVNFRYLCGLAVLALALGLLWSLLDGAARWLAARGAIEAAQRMRRAVYHHAFRLGGQAFRAVGSSEAVSLFTRHVEAVHDALYAWLTITFRAPILLALLLVLALAVNVWLTLVVLLGAVLAWLIGAQVASYFHGRSARSIHQAAGQLALLQESLQLLRLVKCYVMELFNQGRLERQLKAYARAQQRTAGSDALYAALVTLLAVLAGAALLFVAGVVVLDGQLDLAGAALLAAVLASAYLPLRAWLQHFPLLGRGRSSSVALFRFLDRPRDVAQEVGAEVLPPLARQLEFDNVSLVEPGTNRLLLQEISLTVPAGARVALVGPDDREKQALVYLVPRFLDPTAGEIRIDDHNLRWVTLDSLRRQVAVVMQHNLVFNDTVANNISGGDTSYPLARVTEAAKLAHAHQFIQKLPRGYETPIGEMGQSLNVGERFRIALARAILREPAIFIIEEPPGYYLDEDTRDLLDDTFARVLPGRTVLFLPHRLSTVRSCSEVVLLVKGRIEARGTHQALIQQSPLYHHLHYVEFNDFATQW